MKNKTSVDATKRAQRITELQEIVTPGTQVTCIQTYVSDLGGRAFMVLVPVLSETEGGKPYIRNITTQVAEVIGYHVTNSKDRLLSIYTTGYANDIVGKLSEALFNDDARQLQVNYYTDSFYSQTGDKA